MVKGRRLQRSRSFLVEDHELLDQEKPSMKIVGCDFDPACDPVALFDSETGEIVELKLLNGDGEAERLGHVAWIGDAAQIRASYVRRQKTDRRDAGHILRLLLESRSGCGADTVLTCASAAISFTGTMLPPHPVSGCKACIFMGLPLWPCAKVFTALQLLAEF